MQTRGGEKVLPGSNTWEETTDDNENRNNWNRFRGRTRLTRQELLKEQGRDWVKITRIHLSSHASRFLSSFPPPLAKHTEGCLLASIRKICFLFFLFFFLFFFKQRTEKERKIPETKTRERGTCARPSSFSSRSLLSFSRLVVATIIPCVFSSSRRTERKEKKEERTRRRKEPLITQPLIRPVKLVGSLVRSSLSLYFSLSLSLLCVLHSLLYKCISVMEDRDGERDHDDLLYSSHDCHSYSSPSLFCIDVPTLNSLSRKKIMKKKKELWSFLGEKERKITQVLLLSAFHATSSAHFIPLLQCNHHFSHSL